MKIALLQMTSSETVAENLARCESLIEEAVRGGAKFIATPEVTNCIASSRARLAEELAYEADDHFLKQMRSCAQSHGVWILLGSLGVKSEKVEGKFANRSLLIAQDGEVKARYDKIHMFDVTLSETESYRESKTYEAGDKAVLAQTEFGKIGLTICYDLRFPKLHRALAQAGAQILFVPAAFAIPTGEAHWHSLLRARAIENGAFVIAPAQTGLHYEKGGKARRTYGHSLIVDPWGRVLLDAGTAEGVYFAEIDLSEVQKARQRVGSLGQERVFTGP